MGNKKKIKKEEQKAVVAEFKVSMYCNACERTVATIISKFKGVEKFLTDMGKHKVVVTGQFDPQKLMKKLRKKTGKRVEFVVNKESASKDAANGVDWATSAPQAVLNPEATHYHPRLFDCCEETQVFFMFSDENPNACCIT